MTKLGRWWLKMWLFVRWVPSTYWDAFYYLRPRILELGGAAWSVVWGFWVGNPWWDVFPSSPTFQTMGQVAPEWVWGLVVVGVGIGQLIALYNDSTRWRYRISASAFLVWAFVTWLFLISNFSSTATVTYGMMSTMAALAAAKLRWREKMGVNGESPHG